MRRLLRWLARTLLTLVVDAAVWAAIQAAVGYAAHRLPDRWLERDTWLTRPRRFEGGGAFYTRQLRVRRWKHRLPEAGAVFAGGFDKSRLLARRPEHLDRHLVETRRAELGHWVALLPAPLFRRWNPRWLSVLMAAYAVGVNGPCIAAQRYNRLRLARVLDRLDAQEGTVATASRPAPRNGSRDDRVARSRRSLGTTGSSIP